MSRKKADSNLKFAAVFFVFVGGLIILSLFFRSIIFLKDSKFDGSSHFTLEVKNTLNNKKNQIISFSPQTSTIGILTLKDIDPKSLFIPIDASINSNLFFNKKSVGASLLKTFSDFEDEKEINFVDAFRLFLFSKTIKESSISEKFIDSQTEKVSVNSIISTLFIDPQITEEKLNIEIVNSTNVFGLGNKLANYVSNMGGNVILVSTGDEKRESEIDFVKNSYTVDKLSSILNIKQVQVQKKSLPDVISGFLNNSVIIVIGDDSLKKLKF